MLALALSVRERGKQAGMYSLMLLYNQISHSPFLLYSSSLSPAPLFTGFRSPDTQDLTPLATARCYRFGAERPEAGVPSAPSGKCSSPCPRGATVPELATAARGAESCWPQGRTLQGPPGAGRLSPGPLGPRLPLPLPARRLTWPPCAWVAVELGAGDSGS